MELEDERVKTPSSPLTGGEFALRAITLALALIATLVSLFAYFTAPLAIVAWLLFGTVVAVQIGMHRYSRHKDLPSPS